MAASNAPAAHAATWTVNVCSDGTGAGTLRWAILSANGSSGDTIGFSFSSPCTILLGSPLPQIGKAMTINGPGESNLILDGQGLYQVLPVYCSPGGCGVNISGLTIQDGKADYGSGIGINLSNVTVSHVTVKNNTMSSSTGWGAPMTCFGVGSIATLNDVTVSNNSSPSNKAKAGALYSDSGCTLFLNNVTFDGNTNSGTGSAGGYGAGALTVLHAATLNNVTFTNNTTTGSDGGAIYSDGTITVTNSVFTNNSATGHNGGAIYADLPGPMGSIENSTFTGNTASLGAGIMIATSGSLTVTNTSFANNIAATSGGALFSHGNLRITNVTFSGNQANSGYGGAVNNNTGGQATLTNATFDHNSSTSPGSAIINSFGSTATVVNSTIADNSGSQAMGGYSGITLKNTIISNNTVGNCNLYVGHVITDGGGNLNWASGGHDCPGVSADPQLETLASNGGSVQTRALLAGSGAINAGTAVTCAGAVGPTAYGAGGVDARGLPRRNGFCDIGAFEAQPAGLSVVAGSSPQSAVIHTAFPLPLKANVTDAHSNALGGVTVTYAAPSSGPSAILSATTATSNTSGNASVTATANGLFGAAYNVTGTVSGLTSINFVLTNRGLPVFLPMLQR
jgi:predicted outer membrane repeat protein